MLREALCATESTAQHGDNDGGGDEEGDSPCTLTTTNLACFLHSSHIECSCMCPHLRDTSSSWVFLKISVKHAYVHHTIQSVAVDQSEAITEVQNESSTQGRPIVGTNVTQFCVSPEFAITVQHEPSVLPVPEDLPLLHQKTCVQDSRVVDLERGGERGRASGVS
jgi:hypothetical protein